MTVNYPKPAPISKLTEPAAAQKPVYSFVPQYSGIVLEFPKRKKESHFWDGERDTWFSIDEDDEPKSGFLPGQKLRWVLICIVLIIVVPIVMPTILRMLNRRRA